MTRATIRGANSALGGATSCCTEVNVRRTTGSTRAVRCNRVEYRLSSAIPRGRGPTVSG